MIGKRTGGLIAGALLTALMVLVSLAQPASAATRAWSPFPSNTDGWKCALEAINGVRVYSCVIHRYDTEPTYQAALVVVNDRSTGVRLTSAVINLWALPSPSVKVRGDGCLDSSLSAGYGATCYGTLATRSAVCSYKRTADTVTANAAINIAAASPTRITVVSPQDIVGC